MENIPPQYCNADKINGFFGTFGVITNIKLEPHFHKATITYSTHREAQICYNSPDVIFDNRFVKVFWLREDNESTNHPNGKRTVSLDDIEAKKGQAELARKVFLEKLQAKKEAIHNGRSALIEKQLEEQKRIMLKLEDPSLTMEHKRQLMNNMKMLGDSTQSMMASTPKPISIGKQVQVVQTDVDMTEELQEDVFIFEVNIIVCTHFPYAD